MIFIVIGPGTDLLLVLCQVFNKECHPGSNYGLILLAWIQIKLLNENLDRNDPYGLPSAGSETHRSNRKAWSGGLIGAIRSDSPLHN